MSSYAMYLRKSRMDLESELHGTEDTLMRHRTTLCELAFKRGIVIHPENIYEEVVSGETLAARPQMQKLLAEVEQGKWAGVFVMELERLARGDSIDQGIVVQAFRYSGTLIITPTKTYDPQNEFDEEYIEFGLFMSRREYKAIRRRMQAGRVASVKEGKYTGNVAPYGYDRVKLKDQKGWTLAPNPNEAPVVRMIYEWYTDDKNRDGCQFIARKLNKMAIPTRRGGLWTYPTIYGILNNPVYTGKLSYRRRPQRKQSVDGKLLITRPRAEHYLVTDGIHSAIISNEVYQKAQLLMQTNHARPVPGNRELKNPLAGLVKCAKCGRNMVRRPYGVRNKTDTLMCPCPDCHNVSAPLKSVEEAILQALNQWMQGFQWVNPKCISGRETDNQIIVAMHTIDDLEEEIQECQKQIQKIHSLFEHEIYDLDTFASRLQIVKNQMSALTNRRAEANKYLQYIKQIHYSQEILVPPLKDILEGYDKMKSVGDKNNVLKRVLDHVEYSKAVACKGSHGNPNDFQILVYPRLIF